MASFAVYGARLGVVRTGGSARCGGERRSGVDLPSVLFRRKNAFSRTVLSCAGAPGKVLVVEEKAYYSSAAQATSAAAEASSEAEAEEKPEPSEVIEGTDETDDIDGAGMTAKAPLVEEKPRVIPPPGDGQRIHEIDPMLEGFWCHLDYR